jgi:hypothetical protein
MAHIIAFLKSFKNGRVTLSMAMSPSIGKKYYRDFPVIPITMLKANLHQISFMMLLPVNSVANNRSLPSQQN